MSCLGRFLNVLLYFLTVWNVLQHSEAVYGILTDFEKFWNVPDGSRRFLVYRVCFSLFRAILMSYDCFWKVSDKCNAFYYFVGCSDVFRGVLRSFHCGELLWNVPEDSAAFFVILRYSKACWCILNRLHGFWVVVIDSWIFCSVLWYSSLSEVFHIDSELFWKVPQTFWGVNWSSGVFRGILGWGSHCFWAVLKGSWRFQGIVCRSRIF